MVVVVTLVMVVVMVVMIGWRFGVTENTDGDGDDNNDSDDNVGSDDGNGGDYPSNLYAKVCMIQFDADKDNVYVGMKEGLWCWL